MTNLAETTITDRTIRPFRIDVPEAELVELRRRVAATRWPERETVTDASQGVRLATSNDEMHAALDVNIPNYASAIVTTDRVIASLSSTHTSAVSA